MNRRQFLRGTGAALATPALAAQADKPKPNIIFVLADDLGYGDISPFGQKRIDTPNLTRLAAEGMQFTNSYAGSTVCAPSRCSLMSGYHTGHSLVRGNHSPEVSLRPDDVVLPMLMKQAGYRTAMFGKWSLGGIYTPGYPTRKGWDEWFGYFNQSHAHNYYPELLLDGEHERLCEGNRGGRKSEYAHDLFAERALGFIDRMHQSSQPFFLYLPVTIPHANNELGRDTGDGMEVPSVGQYAATPWPLVEKHFAAMVSRLDGDIGRIVNKLKINGAYQNTLLLFSSDNGPHKEGGHDPEYFGSRGGLRGIKRDLYEGGIRVPSIAWWPGTVAGGTKSDFPWAFWDLMPTFAEVAGVSAPAGIDGQSILPTLHGQQQEPHEFLYWECHEGGFRQAVRTGNWKAVRLAPSKPVELYDLATDLGETKNVAAQHPDVVRKIEDYLRTARTESDIWKVKA